jgi:ribonuclease E
MNKILIKISKKKVYIATIKKKKLYNFNIKNFSFKQVNNVYLGKLKNIVHSLESVFVDYGEKKFGLLPFKNISKKIFNCKNIHLLKKNYFIKKNKKILVQILRSETYKKGGLLTTFINLLGVYIILIIDQPHIKKISKKIQGLNREKIKFLIKFLNIPKNMGFIIRTTASGRSIEELKIDCQIQIKKWNLIQSNKYDSYLLKFHQKNNFLTYLLREIIQHKINEIIVNDKKLFLKIKKIFFLFNQKKLINQIKLFKKKNSFFKFYNLKNQISAIFNRKTVLPSGGFFVIDFTEALTVIDINSSYLINSFSIENTAYMINFESVPEILRQLRLKDIGGIIVIDFICMKKRSNKLKIENYLKNLSKKEFSKIVIGKISKFGLLEISRKKIHS